MTARAVIADLSAQLQAVIDMGGIGNRPGHAPGCNQGIWTNVAVHGPEGLPCSKRCKAAHQAIAAGRQWLAEHTAVQLGMEAS